MHIPIEMSPSLRLTFEPPKALRREEVGRLRKENTDRPAFDTCAKALFAITNRHANMISPHFRILKSATKLHFFLHICKYFLHISIIFCNFAAQKVRNTTINKIIH